MTRHATLWLAPAAVIAVLLLAPAALADGRGNRHDDGRGDRPRAHQKDRQPDRKAHRRADRGSDRKRDRGDDRSSVRGRITISTGNASITFGGRYGDHDRGRKWDHRRDRGRHYGHYARPATVRAWVPGHYETRTERVLVEPGHFAWRDVPALYTTRYRHGRAVQILIRPAYREQYWVPDRYETRHVRVWVSGYWKTVAQHRRW